VLLPCAQEDDAIANVIPTNAIIAKHFFICSSFDQLFCRPSLDARLFKVRLMRELSRIFLRAKFDALRAYNFDR
jgi:hypothetical protein